MVRTDIEVASDVGIYEIKINFNSGGTQATGAEGKVLDKLNTNGAIKDNDVVYLIWNAGKDKIVAIYVLLGANHATLENNVGSTPIT